jgi:hypothetical protein
MDASCLGAVIILVRLALPALRGYDGLTIEAERKCGAEVSVMAGFTSFKDR